MTIPISRRALLAGGALAMLAKSCSTPKAPPERLAQDRLPDLPQPLGGQFAGVHNGALIVAGGSYFPVSKWEGGQKQWVDRVYVLREPYPTTAGEEIWEAFALPAPRGYGGTISTPGGLLLIGGSDEKQHHRSVLVVEWDGSRVHFSDAPPLPVPLANCAAAEVAGKAYVVGGQESPTSTGASRELYSLDLLQLDAEWQREMPLPGPGRILPAVAVVDGKLYVASGAELFANDDGRPARRYLQDSWCFTPGEGWAQLPDPPRVACAAPAMGYPDAFLVFGGSDGVLASRENELKDEHPGFSKDILLYRPSTKRWHSEFVLTDSLVTTTATRWGDWTVVPGGEDRPAHRSAVVNRYKYVPEGGSAE